jgi:hypothetical protein
MGNVGLGFRPIGRYPEVDPKRAVDADPSVLLVRIGVEESHGSY